MVYGSPFIYSELVENPERSRRVEGPLTNHDCEISLTCTHFLHIILFTSGQKIRHLGIKGEANGKFEKKARKIENHF
jgi:hypothetical protein